MTTEADYKPGLEDVPAAKSAVSFLDGKKAVLEYRGIPVEVLAKESSFEETSWLLIKGDLPTQKQLAEFDHDLRQKRAIHYRLKDLIKCMPHDGHPMDALHAGVAALGMFYPCPTVTDPAKNWDASCGSSPPCRRSSPRSPARAAAKRSSTRGTTSTTPATSSTCCSARSRRRPLGRCSTRA